MNPFNSLFNILTKIIFFNWITIKKASWLTMCAECRPFESTTILRGGHDVVRTRHTEQQLLRQHALSGMRAKQTAAVCDLTCGLVYQYSDVFFSTNQYFFHLIPRKPLLSFFLYSHPWWSGWPSSLTEMRLLLIMPLPECRRIEKKQQPNIVNGSRRGYLDSRLKIGMRGSRRTISVSGAKKPQWLLLLGVVEPTWKPQWPYQSHEQPTCSRNELGRKARWTKSLHLSWCLRAAWTRTEVKATLTMFPTR